MDEMIFVVRRAVEDDIPAIQAITKEAFKMYAKGAGIKEPIAALNETHKDIKKDINTKFFIVAVLNGDIVGSVRIEIKPDNTAYISRFGVGIEYQNKGVGKILMNAVDTKMVELGIKNLYLHTASRLLSLVRFYYGRGFYIDSTTKECGYIRALLCKEYEVEQNDENIDKDCEAI